MSFGQKPPVFNIFSTEPFSVVLADLQGGGVDAKNQSITPKIKPPRPLEVWSGTP